MMRRLWPAVGVMLIAAGCASAVQPGAERVGVELIADNGMVVGLQHHGKVTLPRGSRDAAVRWDVPAELREQDPTFRALHDSNYPGLPPLPPLPDGYSPFTGGTCAAQSCSEFAFHGDITLQQPLPMDAGLRLREKINAGSMVTVRWTDPKTGAVHLEQFPTGGE